MGNCAYNMNSLVVISGLFLILYGWGFVEQWRGPSIGRTRVPRFMAALAGSKNDQVKWRTFSLQVLCLALILAHASLVLGWCQTSLFGPILVGVVIGMGLLLSRPHALEISLHQASQEDRADEAQLALGRPRIRIGRWTADLPNETYVEIAAGEDFQVSLVTKRESCSLGRLERQLPGAPVRTLFLETGDDRFLIGWVDEAVDGLVLAVQVARRVAPEERQPVEFWQWTEYCNPRTRTFMALIDYRSVPLFTHVSRVSISTTEWIRAHDDYESNWQYNFRFEPGVEIAPLLRHVRVDRKGRIREVA